MEFLKGIFLGILEIILGSFGGIFEESFWEFRKGFEEFGIGILGILAQDSGNSFFLGNLRLDFFGISQKFLDFSMEFFGL